jgi:DNA-binding NtrC family response regulator
MMGRPVILVVDDDLDQASMIKKILSREGYTVVAVTSGRAALEFASQNPVDLVITDLRMPEMDGLELFKAIKGIRPESLTIIVTAYATVESAVEAMKEGVYDYLTKPLKMEEMKLVVGRALEAKMLRDENIYLKKELSQRFSFGQIIGKSKKMQEIYEIIEHVAQTDATVMIYGESGTGKELVARAIHYSGKRKEKPFIAVSCSAFPETLLESELFGYERGAFTGAYARKPGRFELADGGTLFLDEVGEIKPEIQVKLLRVLQDKAFERLGGKETIKVDVRIIAATNKDLEKEVAMGRFREDLYYRLNVIPIYLPPLRERKEDIPLLAEHFLRIYSEKNGKSIKRISPEAMEALMNYSWPGNVRELENVIERMVVLGTGDEITASQLPERIRNPNIANISTNLGMLEIPDEGISLEDVEKMLIAKALAKANGNKSKAAKLLGITRRTLQYRLRKHRLA